MHRSYAPAREILRQLAAECRAGLSANKLTFVYSMEMRSAHGSAGGPVVLARLAKGGVDGSGGGAGELRADEAWASEGLVATGGAGTSVFGDSSGGAMSRASTGKRCACCSDHLAARPFSGLLVLYS